MRPPPPPEWNPTPPLFAWTYPARLSRPVQIVMMADGPARPPPSATATPSPMAPPGKREMGEKNGVQFSPFHPKNRCLVWSLFFNAPKNKKSRDQTIEARIQTGYYDDRVGLMFWGGLVFWWSVKLTLNCFENRRFYSNRSPFFHRFHSWDCCIFYGTPWLVSHQSVTLKKERKNQRSLSQMDKFVLIGWKWLLKNSVEEFRI